MKANGEGKAAQDEIALWHHSSLTCMDGISANAWKQWRAEKLVCYPVYGVTKSRVWLSDWPTRIKSALQSVWMIAWSLTTCHAFLTQKHISCFCKGLKTPLIVLTIYQMKSKYLHLPFVLKPRFQPYLLSFFQPLMKAAMGPENQIGF